MSISTVLPDAFPALAIAHFLALLSPGQDFFLISAHAIRHNLKGSQFIGLGVAIGNAIYIAAAIFGWTGIRDNPNLFCVIELAGGAYLLWIGAQLLKSGPSSQPLETYRGHRLSALKQLWLGLNSALLNPKNALFYMSLMSVILGNHVTTIQQVFCGIWMFSVVLLWDILVAAIIGHERVQRRLLNKVHLIERVAGAILIGIGMMLFAHYLPI